jgi:hypothetical protein
MVPLIKSHKVTSYRPDDHGVITNRWFIPRLFDDAISTAKVTMRRSMVTNCENLE